MEARLEREERARLTQAYLASNGEISVENLEMPLSELPFDRSLTEEEVEKQILAGLLPQAKPEWIDPEYTDEDVIEPEYAEIPKYDEYGRLLESEDSLLGGLIYPITIHHGKNGEVLTTSQLSPSAKLIRPTLQSDVVYPDAPLMSDVALSLTLAGKAGTSAPSAGGAEAAPAVEPVVGATEEVHTENVVAEEPAVQEEETSTEPQPEPKTEDADQPLPPQSLITKTETDAGSNPLRNRLARRVTAPSSSVSAASTSKSTTSSSTSTTTVSGTPTTTSSSPAASSPSSSSPGDDADECAVGMPCYLRR